MATKPGDMVQVRIKDKQILNLNSKEGNLISVKLLAIELRYSKEYLVLLDVYQSYNIDIEDWSDSTGYDVIPDLSPYDKKDVCWVDQSLISTQMHINSSVDGCSCSKCNDFARMASPNQDDGTFICYGCRSNPWR